MGITLDKLLIILVIAFVILGPDKLPLYTQKLSNFVKSVRRMSMSAKDRLRAEMGEEYDNIDWKQLDPRQYDPRKIIRDALLEDKREAEAAERKSRADATPNTGQLGPDGAVSMAPSVTAAAATALSQARENGEKLNFDSEAT